MIDLPPPLLIERPALIRPAPREIIKPDLGIAFAPGFRKPAGVAATLTFQAATAFPNSGQTVTFTAAAIGAAASDRRVFVEIPYYIGGSTNISIASVTIGGVLTTIHAQRFLTSGDPSTGGVALVSALVPTGTTANIVITWAASGAGFYRPEIAVYRVTGLQSTTPVDLVSIAPNTSPPTASVTVAKDGVVFACFNTYSSGSTSRTMTGLTTDYVVSPFSGKVYIGGGSTTAAAGTATATLNNTGSSVWAAIMASFR